MKQEFKMEVYRRSRLLKGLTNLLKDDVEQVYMHADDLDIFSLEEAIIEAKITTQRLMDVATELEYIIYLAKRES